MNALEIYLKHFRITQREFSKDLGTTPNHLSRLLKGKCLPGLELAYKIEKLTGNLVPIYHWIPEEVKEKIESDVENRLAVFKSRLKEFENKILKNKVVKNNQ